MKSRHDKTWALVPADVAEWMGMWEAVPMPHDDVPPAPVMPAPRSWRERLHLSGSRAK